MRTSSRISSIHCKFTWTPWFINKQQDVLTRPDQNHYLSNQRTSDLQYSLWQTACSFPCTQISLGGILQTCRLYPAVKRANLWNVTFGECSSQKIAHVCTRSCSYSKVKFSIFLVTNVTLEWAPWFYWIVSGLGSFVPSN